MGRGRGGLGGSRGGFRVELGEGVVPGGGERAGFPPAAAVEAEEFVGGGAVAAVMDVAQDLQEGLVAGGGLGPGDVQEEGGEEGGAGEGEEEDVGGEGEAAGEEGETAQADEG